MNVEVKTWLYDILKAIEELASGESLRPLKRHNDSK